MIFERTYDIRMYLHMHMYIYIYIYIYIDVLYSILYLLQAGCNPRTGRTAGSLSCRAPRRRSSLSSPKQRRSREAKSGPRRWVAV